MKYLDANVFIYAAVSSDERAAAAKKILAKAASGELAAATSCLTWDEVVWAIGKVAAKDEAAEEGRNILTFPGIRLLNVDSNIVARAQKMVEAYGLDPRDAIHAACALENGISELISDDAHFDKVKELKRIPISR